MQNMDIYVQLLGTGRKFAVINHDKQSEKQFSVIKTFDTLLDAVIHCIRWNKRVKGMGYFFIGSAGLV